MAPKQTRANGGIIFLTQTIYKSKNIMAKTISVKKLKLVVRAVDTGKTQKPSKLMASAGARKKTAIKKTAIKKPARPQKTLAVENFWQDSDLGAGLETSTIMADVIAKPPSPKSSGSNKKAFFQGGMTKIIALIVIIVICILAIDIYGIYKLNWRGAFSYGVAKTFFLPAGRVDGHSIGLADYLDNVKILATAVTKDREGIDMAVINDKQGLNDRIFNLLISNQLVEKELKRYNQNITGKDLDAQMQTLIEQMNGASSAKTTIKDLYGLSMEQFKTKILKPLMAREVLQKLIVHDTSLPINQEAKKQADEVFKMAKEDGVDFKILANQYTQDEAGINIGGDMGWIIRGQVDPELENIIFSLQPNTVYGQVIENSTGYHIVKVEEKMLDKETGKESVKARQILIKVNVDEYIKSLMDKVSIKKFVRL